jgi:uncharacterized protein
MNTAGTRVSDSGIPPHRRFMRRLFSAAARRHSSVASANPTHSRNAGRRLGVAQISITLPHLPPAMDGFRIAQMSDLHLEPWTKEKHIQKAVAMCNALKPDLVALTGDFMTFTARHADRLAEMLAQLEAPHGVFACLGNHDFQSGPREVEKALTERRISVLRNEMRQIHTDGGVLDLAGFDSRYVGRPKMRKTLSGWKTGHPLVLMMHEPDVADVFAHAGIEALQLSGHTHGGQLRFMGMTPLQFRRPKWGKKYLAGHYDVGPLQLYVSRGVGCVGVSFRIGCPPEVTEVTLRSAEVQAVLN